MGPLFGALLYSIGGYVTPFWFLAIVLIAMYPWLFVSLKRVEIADKGLDIRVGSP